MRDDASKNEEAGVDPAMEVPQTEEQQLQQGIEDGTHEVCYLDSGLIWLQYFSKKQLPIHEGECLITKLYDGDSVTKHAEIMHRNHQLCHLSNI